MFVEFFVMGGILFWTAIAIVSLVIIEFKEGKPGFGIASLLTLLLASTASTRTRNAKC